MSDLVARSLEQKFPGWTVSFRPGAHVTRGGRTLGERRSSCYLATHDETARSIARQFPNELTEAMKKIEEEVVT